MSRLLAILLVILGAAGCAAPPQKNYFVFFDRWSVQPGEASLPIIRVAADYARANPGPSITVIGYADPEGSLAANKDLSVARAETVRAALVAEGVAAGRIRPLAHGEIEPKWSSQEARRVEIRFGDPGLPVLAGLAP